VRSSAIPDSLLSTLAEAIPPEQRPDEPVLASAPYLIEFDEEVDEFELDPEAESPPDESLPVVDLACAIELPPGESSPEIDPARETELPPDELTPEPPFSVRRQAALVSFAAHLIVLLLVCNVLFLLTWPKPKIAAPIPVRLVLEEPPPEPLPQTEASKPPPAPPGRLSSEEIGDVTKPPPQAGAGAPAPNDAPMKAAAAAVPPPPPPPPEPQPPKEALAAPAPPKPKPPPPTPAPPKPTPAAARVVVSHPSSTPQDAPRVARFVGASATRDEYLAQLLALTRQHIYLLPRSLLASREGETILSIRVLDDGTVARIAVAQSSGYPDIDRRVEQMVAAVGRFPPLPQWYQAPSVDLNLRLRFPDALDN
jgi:protein TonB